MDFDKIKPPVFVRNWIRNSGEKFYPLGFDGSKKLHDFFIDNKVPFDKRTGIPVFADAEKVIWVGKMRLDERVKIDKNTRRILHIKIIYN